ncbi:C40 family peptidase, partial [Mycobacterium palustre]|uniref:C40 family peptidase n=1 Tax=Mycobacterium palustre TaxID=153971 RepID=UPI000A16AEAF
YRWGAAGPDAFDCSGLVVWAYAQIGTALPHSSQALARGGQPIARANLEPGDVVVYYRAATHVGLYSGDGMVIHASTPGRPVVEVPIDAAGPYNQARRY